MFRPILTVLVRDSGTGSFPSCTLGVFPECNPGRPIPTLMAEAYGLPFVMGYIVSLGL